jgi:tetratricopeptide (TPR) repeat protein
MYLVGWFKMATRNMNTIKHGSKSEPCLHSAFEAFQRGEVESAIRCLNITFNHATNTDWSDGDTIRILQCLSWLYFYEGRNVKAATLLERAIKKCTAVQHIDRSHLAHLHYNLAEFYLRDGQFEPCKKNFLSALRLIRETLGTESKSFVLVRERYLEIFQRSDFCRWRKFGSVKPVSQSQLAGERADESTSSVHSLTLRTRELAMV